MRKKEIFWSAVLGIGLLVGSVLNLPDGGTFRGFSVPSWGRWLLLFVGIAILCLTISSALRKKRITPSYTDEDVLRAKKIMDKMYLREHGEPPPAPRQDEQENDVKKEPR